MIDKLQRLGEERPEQVRVLGRPIVWSARSSLGLIIGIQLLVLAAAVFLVLQALAYLVWPGGIPFLVRVLVVGLLAQACVWASRQSMDRFVGPPICRQVR